MGVIGGNGVQSKHVGSDFVVSLKGLFGSEVKDHAKMLTKVRDMVMRGMVKETQRREVDAVVNIRFNTSAMMGNASEVVVYGAPL